MSRSTLSEIPGFCHSRRRRSSQEVGYTYIIEEQSSDTDRVASMKEVDDDGCDRVGRGERLWHSHKQAKRLKGVEKRVGQVIPQRLRSRS